MASKKVVYVAVFFDGAELEKLFPPTLEKAVAEPHDTVCFQPKPDEIHEELFGETVLYKVIGYGNDGENEGLLVRPVGGSKEVMALGSQSGIHHITLSVSTDGKPVNTKALSFQDIDNGPVVAGRYGAFTGKEVVFSPAH